MIWRVLGWTASMAILIAIIAGIALAGQPLKC